MPMSACAMLCFHSVHFQKSRLRKMALSPMEKVLPFSLISTVLDILTRISKDTLANNKAPRPYKYRLCLCGRQSCFGEKFGDAVDSFANVNPL